MSKKIKIFLNYFLGPVLFLWLIYSIYHQLAQQKNLTTTWQIIRQSFHESEWWKLLATFFLMFVNWGIESRKWQILISKIQQIHFFKSFKAVFAGQAIAFNTINSVGEYIGRMMFMNEGNRLRSVAFTVVGNISQVIVTFFMGVLGLLYMRFYILDDTHTIKGLSNFWFDVFLWMTICTTIFFLLLYFALSWVIAILERIPFISRFTFFIQKLEDLHYKELTRILWLSFIRYLVFVLQYLLLLQLFKVDSYWMSLASIVAVLFLVLAVVPSIALAELGLRGEVSILLFGILSSNTIGIILTATGIWLINRVLPALAGSLFILGLRLFKK